LDSLSPTSNKLSPEDDKELSTNYDDSGDIGYTDINPVILREMPMQSPMITVLILTANVSSA
jgi:hypothetical protein